MTEVSFVLSGGWTEPTIPASKSQVVHVPPAPWAGGRVGKCYSNVQSIIRQAGGEAVYGWALTDFGPHRITGGNQAPLYRRWLNHVVWRDAQGQLWEVSPNAVVGDFSQQHFAATEFLIEQEATFDVRSEEEWLTRPTRYLPLRPEGVRVTEMLTRAQHATDSPSRNYWLNEALASLQLVGFRPREWKVETIGNRTGSIWLIAE
jgi:hypothetical protein